MRRSVSTGVVVLACVWVFSTVARAEPPAPEPVVPVASSYAATPGAPTLTLAAPPPPAPSLSPAPPPRHVSIARRWWFWTALGAAAVGVVVVGIVLAPKQPYSGNASPGVVTAF